MLEKRRDKRLKAELSLRISSLFKQDNVLVGNINAPIQVTDISKGGIGFISESELPLGFYFNADIQLGEEDASLYCVVKIIRKEVVDGMNMYGCEMVGLAPVLSYIFENYERTLNSKENAEKNAGCISK